MKALAKEYYNLANKFNNLAKELKTLGDDSIRDTFDDVERDLDIEFYHCVDKFYKEYTPRFYDRTYSLYEGYKFDRGNDGLSLNWETNENLIPDTHRAAPEYIFALTFEHGQHGGSIKNGLLRSGLKDAEGNIYNWMWGAPAKKGMPINFRIQQSFMKYKKSNKMQMYFDHYISTNFNKMVKKHGLDMWF